MNNRSFFARLFDMSFSEFVTPSIIQIIYTISIFAAGLAAIGVLIGLSQVGGAGAFLGLIMAVVGFFIYVIIARVTLEAVVALFRIAENTRVMADKARQSGDQG